MASSTELSTISQTRWCSPAEPTPPIYIPGRLRTGSSPSRTVMSLAVYVVAMIEGLIGQGLGGAGRLNHHAYEFAALEDFPAFAATGAEVVVAAADALLAAERRFEHERVVRVLGSF